MKRLIVATMVAAIVLLSCSCGRAENDTLADSHSLSSAEPPTSHVSGQKPEDEPVTVELFAMDTFMTMAAYGENAEMGLKKAQETILRIDDLLSTGNPNSDLSVLNRKKDCTVSDEAFGLIKRAVQIGADTGGVFDVSVYPLMRAWGFTDENYRVPSKDERAGLLFHVHSDQIRFTEGNKRVAFDDPLMEIDLGGIAKGYAADMVIEDLKASGVEHALVNLGGNVRTLGMKPNGDVWRVGIQDPEDAQLYIGGLESHDEAIVTSAGYQRYFEQDGHTYFHIIDLSDGLPAENGLISATVVAKDGTLADALSTTLFIMGLERSADYWRDRHDEFEAVLVEDDGSIWITQGLVDSYSSTRPIHTIGLDG